MGMSGTISPLFIQNISKPLCLLACVGLVLGCPKEPEPPENTEKPYEYKEVLGLPACDTADIEQYPDHRCFSYRAVAGVSMGGGASSKMGFTYPELFDVVGVMGTPFSDTTFFWNMMINEFMGGFCDLETLEAVMAAHPDNPDILNDPTVPGVFCGLHDITPEDGYTDAYQQVEPHQYPSVENSQCYMFRSDYNNWYRGPDAGRGGTFSRNGLTEIFHDIVAAYGNPLYHNPDSNYFPPGVDESNWYTPPGENKHNTEMCNNPVVLENFYNKEFNPNGTYPVITFCDGATGRTGAFDPTQENAHNLVVDYLLAVDLNGNGKREYGEPVLSNHRERFEDTGTDGLADEDEPGYDATSNPDPSGDNWDPTFNIRGTEKNATFDEGEVYEDFGLDGVADTNDYGEGNGAYDISPGLAKILEVSPAKLYREMPQAQVERLDVWMDAGIRDFINSAQITNALFSEMQLRLDDTRAFNDFPSLPGIPEGESYTYFKADYSREAMGQITYLRYGDPDLCPASDEIMGEGNHVGPSIVNRLYTLFSFLSARIPPEGRDSSFGGDVSDLEGPTGTLEDFGFLDSYHSEVLGRDNEFGVLLPPDYYLERSIETDERYPVMYFFHGQGQSAADMVLAGLAIWGSMKESFRSDRQAAGLTDLQRAIIVWADGECKTDECWTGNFYANFQGMPRANRNYEDAMIELMQVVEERYRTKRPALVPLKDL